MRKFRTKQSITVGAAPSEPIELMRFGCNVLNSSEVGVLTEPGVEAYNVRTGELIPPTVVGAETGLWQYDAIGCSDIVKFVTSSGARILEIYGRGPAARRYGLMELNCDAISTFPTIDQLSGRRNIRLALRGTISPSALEFAQLAHASSAFTLLSLTTEQDAVYTSAELTAHYCELSGFVTWSIDGTGWTYGRWEGYIAVAGNTIQAWNAMQTYPLKITGESLYFPNSEDGTTGATGIEYFAVLSKSLSYDNTPVDQADLLTNSAIEYVNATITLGLGQIYDRKGPVTISGFQYMLYDADMTAELVPDAQTELWYPQTIESECSLESSQEHTFAVLISSRGGRSEVSNIANATFLQIACLKHGIADTYTGNPHLSPADDPDVSVWPASAQNTNMRLVYDPATRWSGTSRPPSVPVALNMPVYVRGFALELQNLANQSATGGGFYLTGASGSISILNTDDHSLLSNVDFTNSSQLAVIDSNFFVDSETMAESALFQVSADYTPSSSNPMLMPVSGSNVSQDFSAATLVLDLNELNRIGKLADIFSTAIAGTTEYGFGFSTLHIKTDDTALVAEAVGYLDGLTSVLTTNATLTIEVDTADALAAAQTAYAELANPPSQTITFAVAS